MADAGVMTEARPIATDLPEPTPIKTLQEKYSELAARYRTLGRQQFDTGLNQEELGERQKLEELAQNGFFDPAIREDQLRFKEKAFQDNEEPTDPSELGRQYQTLGIKLVNNGLNAEEVARYEYLTNLAKQGKFESADQNNLSKVA